MCLMMYPEFTITGAKAKSVILLLDLECFINYENEIFRIFIMHNEFLNRDAFYENLYSSFIPFRAVISNNAPYLMSCPFTLQS